MLAKARVIKASQAAEAKSAQPRPAATARARIIPRVIVNAHAAAAEVQRRAQREAEDLRRSLGAEEARVLEEARKEGFAQGVTEAVAACVGLAKFEATSDARGLERTVELARLLAERLLGEALQTSDAVAVQLAKQVLSEVRGATRVRLEVSPVDEPALAQHLRELDVSDAALELSIDSNLASGEFRVQTNVGSLEASLGARLQLLSQKLLEGLRP